MTPEIIESIRGSLIEVRQASLLASRLGDYRQVARLGKQTAEINLALREAKDFLANA